MRPFLATCLVAGCSFEHGQLALQPDSGSDDPDPTVDASTIARSCKFPDPQLRLCLEFDDRVLDPVVHDGSPHQLDAPATNLADFNRDTFPAAAVNQDSRLQVPESATLDITGGLTLEMWVAPGFSQPKFLINNSGQYALSVDAYGNVTCQVAGAAVWGGTQIDPLEWSHVACTFDGSLLRAFVDGVGTQCRPAVSPIATSGTSGTTIANGFVGAIDDIRIYARALTPAEVCTHAGESGCSSACSTSGPGGGTPDD